MCSGCGSPILDQFILRVAPDLEWHASCLKCADCGLMLEEMRTCFVRDGKTYCKMDYLRSVFALYFVAVNTSDECRILATEGSSISFLPGNFVMSTMQSTTDFNPIC